MNRRSLLQVLGGLTAAPLLGPSLAQAAPKGSDERKFLFVFADGGWDTTKVFTPFPDHAYIQDDGNSYTDTIGNITYAASPRRQSVTDYFTNWGDQTAILNGMEVRSITHERCTRIAMTGYGGAGFDDWASILAGNSAQDLLLPHVVLSGPTFSNRYTSSVVRAGDNLLRLLNGSSLTDASPAIQGLNAEVESLTDAYVRQRIEQAHARTNDPREAFLLELYDRVLESASQLSETGQLELEPESDGCNNSLTSELSILFDCMEQGLARTGVVQFLGKCDIGWDSHSSVDSQDDHFDLLFGYLDRAMADLATRSSPSGGSLADELTIVVLSEMGRHPLINSGEGKGHWTYTSAMLIGSGVKGDTVVGGMDDDFIGQSIDLATGELDGGDLVIVPQHLGATLLALADIDPGEHVDAEPILAMIDP